MTITIEGIKYNVIRRWTPEDYEANGYNNVANMLREYQEDARLVLQRPRGSTYYETREISRFGPVQYTAPYKVC